MTAKQRASIIAIAASVVAALVASLTTVGRVARLPDVLVLFFSGVAAGAGVAVLVRRIRTEKPRP